MANLVIKCPHTGRAISTASNSIAPRLWPEYLTCSRTCMCPECGLEHAWWTREAWLEDEAKVSPRQRTRLLRPAWLA